MTGYQEILTDPSYAGQIITFTFPHIGNVGTNDEDIETVSIGRARAGGAQPTSPSRPTGARPAPRRLAEAHGVSGISRHRHPGADHPHPRWRGMPNGVWLHARRWPLRPRRR
jgi:carbamoyl-phosphate synthase small subunit